MTTQACPRCGKPATVEEPAPATFEIAWLRCDACEHVWQGAETPSDAFSLIVGGRPSAPKPVSGERPLRGPLRALRFEVKVPARFRAVGTSSWQTGTTVNVSETGIFFRVQRVVPPNTDIEILLELPVEEGEVEFVRCSGRSVRSVPPVRPGAYASLAVVVSEYHIGTDAPPQA